jgi:Skp family chaperone for outer membrane proteins
MRIIFLSLIGLLFVYKTSAQQPKIGFIYSDYVLQNLPQTKQLQAEIDVKKQAVEVQLKAKAEKYQAKYAAYQEALKDLSTTTTESLNALVKDVQDLKKNAEDTQAKAETELRTYAGEKLTIIQELIEKTQQSVAKEKGYSIVFRRNIDSGSTESQSILLYAINDNKDNLSDAIIIKLGGIPPKK